MSDQLMIAARKIMRETGRDFVWCWNQAKVEHPELVQATNRASEGAIATVEASYTGRMSVVSGAAPAGGTSYSINDPDAANERLHETSNGPAKPRVDASSSEKLLAAAKKIQSANPKWSWMRCWQQAALENPELVGFQPSGGYAQPSKDVASITNVGPKTAAIDGLPALGPA